MTQQTTRPLITYAEDSKESVSMLMRLRAPSLVVGLVLGIGISFLTSGFEEVLASNVHVAFFLPFVVYIADAIGSQTEAIYARELKSGNARFGLYLGKESVLGLLFGVGFGLAAGLIVWVWLHDQLLAVSVGSATALAVCSAPVVALCVTQLVQRLREDPAAGSGPVTTVIQDMTSIFIYGLICSWFLL